MNATAKRKLLEKCEAVSVLLGSLVHSFRLKVLCQTLDSEKNVSDLTEFCEISQSSMSQFLGRMKSDGLLQSRREGTKIYHAIKDPRVVHLLPAFKKNCT